PGCQEIAFRPAVLVPRGKDAANCSAPSPVGARPASSRPGDPTTMKAFLPASLAALALSALLPAQTRVDVTLATVDASGVHANRQTDAVRAGTVVERALRLTAHDGRTVSASSLAAPDSFRT